MNQPGRFAVEVMDTGALWRLARQLISSARQASETREDLKVQDRRLVQLDLVVSELMTRWLSPTLDLEPENIQARHRASWHVLDGLPGAD